MGKLTIQDITTEAFRELVGNRIFTVTFIKANGEERNMNGLLDVSKYVTGGNPEATAKKNETLKARNMVCVFDLEKSGYRTLNLGSMTELKANGIRYDLV